jgi:ABC-type multidrug transport system fused ATPase/permease subunit
MASDNIVPENIEERLIYRALVGAWGFYAVGAVYIVGPVLAVTLLGIWAWRSFAEQWRPQHGRQPEIPAGVVVWAVGMLMMLTALLVAHIDNDLGFGATLKSAIGWMKGWALLAMFPFAGACLHIRPQLVVRAAGRFCTQTLVLMPFLIMAGIAHLPYKLYISPLQVIGGPGPEFFSVYLYIIDPSDHSLRWQFIAPWAPAAGMLGNMLFVMALYDRNRRYKIVGIIASVMICFMTRSRMAMLFLVVYPPVIWSLSRISKPWLLMVGAVVSGLGGIVMGAVIEAVQNAVKAFRSARMDSTRVREALGRIALERWWEDAPIWGHGVVVKGRHFVEFMPIGSHHTWFGLLYVKGAVGAISLLIPLLWTMIEMIILAQITRIGRLGLTMTLLVIFYSFGENLEILAYLIWPALLLIGSAFRRGVATAATPSVASIGKVEELA